MMIPEIGQAGPIPSRQADPAALEDMESPSRTYRMDWDKQRITGQTDGLEAVKQAVAKILRTLRYEHLIYSSDYGTEWNLVLGQDRLLVRAEIKRIVGEALLQDDRITALEDMLVTFSGDDLALSCTVVTRYGNFQWRKEMDGNV